MIRLTLPIRTVSEKNQREFWAKKARRVKAQRQAFALVFGAKRLTKEQFGELDSIRSGGKRGLVTLTRIAPRTLDDDNVRQALSAFRDETAACLCIDDRDPRVTWDYAQRRGKAGEYGVEVCIERRET